MRDAFEKAGIKVSARNPSPARRGSGPHGRRGPGLPSQKLPDSYFAPDADGRPCLRTEFVTRDTLEPIVKSLKQGRLTTGQMRRFFNHCREIERQLSVEGKSWERVSARFASTSAHAHNAGAAGKIPSRFRKFIDENVKRVLESDQPSEAFLRGFMPHFEALVGFSAQHLKKGV